MKDLAKMREKFEQELKYAEIENKVEQKLGFEGFRVVGESLTQKGKIHTFFANKLGIEQARSVLKEFEPTEKIKVSGKDIWLYYLLKAHRYPNEPMTVLQIEWISGDYDLGMEMYVDDKECLKPYFKPDWYEIDNHDIGLFYGAVSPRQKSALKVQRFLSFNSGNVIRYQGGYRYQVNDGVATALIAELIGE